MKISLYSALMVLTSAASTHFVKIFRNIKRLTVNYRSTRCIVEAASSLIHNNLKRCHSKQVETDNSTGCKITVKECPSESAQCAYVVDKILEIVSDNSVANNTFGDIAILYRRQVTGKAFQSSLRDRKIPFNVHGVAFYRKKVIRAVIAILRTTLPDCGDAPFRQSFKALLLGEKEEKKKVIEYIEKISAARKISFFTAASDIYRAKVSGTFKRAQLSDGRKVLNTLDMLSKLVEREQSISAVITSAAAVIPQKYLLEKRAAIDVDGGKYLNEDNDFRSVLQYLSDDVSEFLSTHFNNEVSETDRNVRAKGCAYILKAFLDHISMREAENFQVRKRDNGCSVTLTTIHQSKGLEWDTVFIVKVNESEIPLLHEFNGTAKEGGATLEEERRLLYVAMTRARKKLYILYVIMDSNWQLLQPSRFLKELPANVVEDKVDKEGVQAEEIAPNCLDKTSECVAETSACKSLCKMVDEHCHSDKDNHAFSDGDGAIIYSEACFSNDFLKGFNVENRAIISHMFHQWAKKSAFQNPRRLLDKVGFVIDERLRSKTCKSKDLLRALKASLRSDDAFQYARQVLHWEQIPFDQRAHLMREKQEHFQKQRVEISMGSSEATAKQIAYLQMLGCTIVPSSRLHASRLIEQYKSV